ncbi:4Fe-4S dicluster-binding protein [Helicobacter sp. 11S03491-1]|uniref:4Fe-4S dicluster domain-containing protein n=1 Tax=Helicobacter sp. 11S03491-1 TaxID=1476196 RepID=UPI000BA68596|nr:4Fe-4S dicluster-binding protein [Helicobacter sp. 11S03491-1]PAF42646.1 pyruvate ferredoxin oxidoreductase [Helicobacter sp. 11S03491-1]
MKGWNDFEIGAVLFPFKHQGQEALASHNNERDYTQESSFNSSVAHWRVDKPVHNSEVCINCFNCWVYCPDGAILARDEKLRGVDYVHCKGCGVCVDVCPTNPKSLLMFSDHEDNQTALKNWPKKEEKKRD